MSKKMLTDARAIAAYKKAISGTTIYRRSYIEKLCRLLRIAILRYFCGKTV